MEKTSALAFILTTALLLGFASAYTTQIHAPAVLENQNSGVLTLISLNLTPGDGYVNITGPQTVGLDTQASAQTAAQYASIYMGVNESDYNFTYDIHGNSENVSGPSAGLAFTLLAISAFKQQPLYNNFTVTGTINPDGSVGEVGGVYDKLGAAKANGMNYALVPSAAITDPEYLIYYLTQQKYDIPIVQVSNVSQALPYAYSSGSGLAKPFVFNLSRSFNLKGLPDANVGCSGCNVSYFGMLLNYTLNFSQTGLDGVGSNFDTAKDSMYSNLAVYRNISSKGYLYAAADYAFLQYPDIFVLANSNNVTQRSVEGTISNITLYCDSLTPPQLTNLNYEYVIGGELRQSWGLENLKTAEALANSSQTTDDLFDSLDSASTSYAWCGATGELYKIADMIGGSPVAFSSNVKTAALSAIENATPLGPDIYLLSAGIAYNKSEYGTALYDAVYAKTFGSPPTSNYTTPQLENMTVRNGYNSTQGIWPSEFADSALFNLYQAETGAGNQNSNITSAYTTSELALGINAANKLLISSFVSPNQTSTSTGISIPVPTNQSSIAGTLQSQSAMISSLQTQVSQLYALLVIMIIIVAILAILVFDLILKGRKEASPKKGRRGRKNKG